MAAPALNRASLVFFFVFVMTLIAAGTLGIAGARVDMHLLLRLHIGDLPDRVAANLLSRYRFLRAIELGFGLFALAYWRQIYRRRSCNRLFLFTMACGVGAGLLSVAAEGAPSLWMYASPGWELVGVVLLFLSTRTSVVAA